MILGDSWGQNRFLLLLVGVVHGYGLLGLLFRYV
jgi:hypothetical protein